MPSRLAQVAAAQVPVVKVSNFLERLACRKHDGLQYLAGGSRSAVLRINCRGWRRWPVNLGAVLSSRCVSAASRQRELEQLQAGLSALERRGLFTFREDHLWPVIGRPVDQGRNLVGLHQVGRTGRQHDPQQPRILHIIVRSERPRIPGEHRRDPVMDGAEQVVGLGGDDGAGAGHPPQGAATSPRGPRRRRVLPASSRSAWGFWNSHPPPFLITVGQDQAPPPVNAVRKLGSPATVSARALIRRLPTDALLA